MIPSIQPASSPDTLSFQYLDSLSQAGFEGDLAPEYSDRLMMATDNSIYQLMPQAAIYPKSQRDVCLAVQIIHQPGFRSLSLTPRGGGTGTNGQSLNTGVIMDVSRHMNGILEINAEEGWARVQAGVVKDQLNKALKPYDLFFAPELSTSNRATIGGMINTDASGQGSVKYGKTRDHVLSLSTVLSDGTLWQSEPLSEERLEEIKQGDNLVAQIHREADQIVTSQKDLIEQRFPKLNRCLTGYDLAHVYTSDSLFDLNALLCGSEGSLGVIVEAKINLEKKPPCSALVNLPYDSFNSALRDAQNLMSHQPTSIETVDSKVLQLAMEDIVWDTVSEYFPAQSKPIKGINLVEYTADTEEELEQIMASLLKDLDDNSNTARLGYSIAKGPAEVTKIWAMRKKAVGLLGNAKGDKRPIPFVEDTAVPPENLADYIAEFRLLLDGQGLDYGMFGHVDAGVLHVRPAIDMKDPEQEKLIRVLSDQLVSLTQKYKGLLWGEHGKGIRSEYAPEYFGPLYPSIQAVKSAFDPYNQFNPGKIAIPEDQPGELMKVDGVATRGQRDRIIPAVTRDEFSHAMTCNGNGACFNFDPDDPMCPSWKATRHRHQSPKGRAGLMREWLYLLTEAGAAPSVIHEQKSVLTHIASWPVRLKNKFSGDDDFSDQVYTAMAGCLACKSCASQCPIRVDIPTLRSQFLAIYHSRYPRPAKDYMVASLEHILPWVAKFSWPYDLAVKFGPTQKLFSWLGLVDLPTISQPTLNRADKNGRLPPKAAVSTLNNLSDADKKRSIILVQDAFTSYFESNLVLDASELLQKLGFLVWLAPYHPNGKAMQVHGFLGAFGQVATNNARHLQKLSATGVSLAGIEPATTLAYRQEYTKVDDIEELPEVLLIQEWLAKQADALKALNFQTHSTRYKLLTHCTEKTNAPQSTKHWQQVFAALNLILEPVATGCCGMAGTYGHETRNVDTSKTIYQQSWSKVIEENQTDNLMATGYSCRSQVKRLDQVSLNHPLQALLKLMASSQ